MTITCNNVNNDHNLWLDATPGRLLVMALRRAEQFRVNKYQENRRRPDFILNTGRLSRSQCRRLALVGEFFGPEGGRLHPMTQNGCHANSLELVRADTGLELWTGLAFSDHCSDGGTNGWFAHSWVADRRGVIVETSPDGTYRLDALKQWQVEWAPWQGYYGIRLQVREVSRWLLRHYGQR